MLGFFCVCVLILRFNQRNAGWRRQCPVNERLRLHTEGQRAHIRNTVLPHVSALSPQQSLWNYCWLVQAEPKYHFTRSSLQKSKSVSPFKAQSGEQWEKKKQPGIRAQPCRVDNPSLSLAWGKQLPGAFQYTDVASFLHSFFSNISSAIPLIYIGTSLFLQAEQPLHLKSNHINVSGLSTSSTWQETSLYSSTPCQTF